MFRRLTRPAAFATACSITYFACAQAGDQRDAPGSVQEEIWKQMDVPPAPILSPEEALESFSIAPGFRLELVAAEPLVNDPVAMTWDEHGRLWVAEMWAYMPNPDGDGEDEPVSRVVVLEDLDQDGRMDRSTVFKDRLVLPRTLAIVQGGVLIADPPYLLFCEDLDGDLKSDQLSIVTEYANVGNVEHAENGLLRGIDNWLYNAKSSRRLKFAPGVFEEEQTLFRGQWGITMDDWGRLYYNHNSSYLFGDAMPWEYVGRNPGWTPQVGMPNDIVPDSSVLTARINPGINRAYRPNYLREDNRMKKVDAASDPEIYRGNRYPDSYHGNAFVPDPAGNIVARIVLDDQGMGIVGTKQLHEHSQWGPIEFIASTDERFRPVNISNGPDGFLYIVDMYRGIIQHKTYLTTFLRKQIIERELDQPVGLGRIYRLVHESDNASRQRLRLAAMSPLESVKQLSSDNGWTRDTAQRLLVQSAPLEQDVVAALRKSAVFGNELTRIHSLWTLHAIEAIDETLLLDSLPTATPWTQVHIWRVAEKLLPSARQNRSPLWDAYQNALRSENVRIRLQAIQLAPKTGDAETVVFALSGLDKGELYDPYFLDTAMSSVYGYEDALLKKLESLAYEPKILPLVSGIGFALFNARNAEQAASLLSSLPPDSWVTHGLVEGLSKGSSQKNSRPLILDTKPEFLSHMPASLRLAASKAFTWPNKFDPDAAQDYQYSPVALESIARGKPLYDQICAVCHQPDGLGQKNLAPPLAGSQWVTGSKTRLALIVSQGLSGEIEVNGQNWNQVMPPNGSHPLLQGDNLTDLLNYIRSAWNNNAAPYTAGEPETLLAPFASRNDMWTVPELEKALTEN